MRGTRALTCLVLAAACSSTPARPVAAPTAAPSAAPQPSTALPARSPAPASPVTPALPPGSPTGVPVLAGPTKALVVVEENHTDQQALAQMPYLAGLAATYGRASDYRAVAHPSLPNYLAIAGGSTFGVHDDAGPSAHPLSGASVFGQALAAGRTAKAYVDAMTSPCQAAAAGTYAVKHNPWAYFAAERGACAQGDVPLGGALQADAAAGRLPDVGMLVPDLCHDGHDCPLSTADGWLREQLGPVLDGPDFRTGRLAVVVTFDEDDSSGTSNAVLTVVLHRSLHQRVATAPLSHLSLSRWLSDLTEAPPLRSAGSARSLWTAF
ncbi:MAG: alkaline phosphatase family protein [Mycobacteriales bacterium]